MTENDEMSIRILFMQSDDNLYEIHHITLLKGELEEYFLDKSPATPNH